VQAPSRERPIECEGVGYVYAGGTRANQGIDLALERGELFCLLGPNGAGKTTLIRQITTELRPTEGRIRVGGRDAHADPIATKRRLGVIPQSAALFEGLRVEEHLSLFGPLKHLSRAATRERVELVVKECELGALRARRVRTLSGGERRKVLVALALLSDPEILILDEPSVGLDPVARRALWSTIERQREQGKTILLTTHYMDEAERLADRIGFIGAGRLTRTGTLASLYAQLGKSVRVTELDPGDGSVRGQHYFDELVHAQAFVRERKLDTYAVGRVSLEDIYLRVMGRGLGAESAP
jgi:ABC-2 type transport system ATP-binding protein